MSSKKQKLKYIKDQKRNIRAIKKKLNKGKSKRKIMVVRLASSLIKYLENNLNEDKAREGMKC